MSIYNNIYTIIYIYIAEVWLLPSLMDRTGPG